MRHVDQQPGADPGPAGYARGGTEPTVTDANAVLGRLAPEFSLAGDLELDFAAKFGVSEEDFLKGILKNFAQAEQPPE